MNATKNEGRYCQHTMNTLTKLQRVIHAHLQDLMEIECIDADAADAITFAIQQAEEAMRSAKRAAGVEWRKPV